jgi:hypothetical protein
MLKVFNSFGKTFVAVLFATVLLFNTASAQATTGTITGRVVDAQGAVVPGAKVTVTSRATGAERTAIANSDGEYSVPNIPPGRYNVSAEAATFSRALIEDVELLVGARQTLNFDMKAGNVSETVTITTDQPLVETTKSELDQSITPQEIENLPLLNCTFAGLSVIAPEARPVGNFDPTKTRVGNIAFAGGDGRQVNVNIDGGDNKDNVVGSLLQNFSYESIQEFQVIQHRWTAEQGRSVGGIVNVITKSGGNQFRGSLFGNFRNQSMRAFDFFDDLAKEGNPNYGVVANPNYEKPSFNRQEFGGSIGGPIVKDKTFFFFALERFRERQNVGIFPGAVADLQLIPGVEFVSEIPSPYNDTLLSAKVDHRFNDRHSIFGRFSYQGNDSPNDQVTNPARTDLSGGNFTTNKLYSGLANYTFNINNNTLNVFTFHFQDFVNEILPVEEGLTLAFPGGITIGQNANTPQSTKERKFQFRDDVSVVSGNHTMKFGVNYIHTILDGYFYFGTRGYSLTFGQTPRAIALLPQGFSTPGILTGLTFSDGASSHAQTIDQLAFYAQDDWKITRNLTLNLGIRWDANFGNLPDQTNNRTIQILRTLNHPTARAITGDPEKLARTTPSYKEFQPRIGFAWDPWGDAKTVIRGGYGVFYDQVFQNLSLFSATQAEPQVFQTAISLTAAQLATFRYGVDPLPALPANFNFGNLANGAVGRINDPDATEPYVQKFSLGFQRELSSNMSISSDFVHTLGIDEPRFMNMNPQIRQVCDALYPGSNPADARCVRGAASRVLDSAFVAAGLPANRLEQINMFATTNRSLFDSWTTTLKYRSSKWLFNASYVLASSRSWGGQPTASYSGNGIVITPEKQFAEGEFGPTRMDERHRVVISGVFNLPWDIQLSPILQLASARPFSANTGIDIDGDGLTTIDRLCEGVSLQSVFAVRGNNAAILGLNPRGCRQQAVNGYRSGFFVESDGSVKELSHRFFNVDLRASKTFKFGERFRLSGYLDLYNVFNSDNLAFGSNARLGLSVATSGTTFMQPSSLFGPGFGPPIGRPLTAQLGARFTF